MFGIMQHLSVVVCENADDAIQKGYDYKGTDIKAVQIDKAVVVKNGTQAGDSTVDFLLSDEAGNRYVVLVTGNLLKTLVHAL
jgi:hypothetical protein